MGLTDWTAGTLWADAVSAWADAVSAWVAPVSDWGVPAAGDTIAAQAAISISTTATNVASSDPYNPYDDGTYAAYLFATNYDTGDIAYTEADGKFTFDVTAPYMVDICTFVSMSASDAVDQDVLISGGSVWNPITDAFLNAVTDPISMPVNLILDISATDFLEYFIEATGAPVLTSHNGSTITLVEVPDIEGSPDLHLISVSCDDSTIQNQSPITPFHQGFYVVPPGSFTTHVSNGIVFTPADGKFTINRDANYLIQIVLAHEAVTVTDFDWELQKNGVQIWNPDTNQNHQAVDPAVRTIVLVLTLEVDDFLELEIDYIGAAGGSKPGTSMSIMELGT